jgi:hypothetical protein
MGKPTLVRYGFSVSNQFFIETAGKPAPFQGRLLRQCSLFVLGWLIGCIDEF